jgi:hypothetical protein
VLRIETGERRPERRQHGGIGVAARKVARVRRQRRAADHPQRRLGRDDGSAAAIGADEAALLERAVCGRDGRGADLELGRKVANGGQPLGGRKPVLCDRRLDRRGDRRSPSAPPDLLC